MLPSWARGPSPETEARSAAFAAVARQPHPRAPAPERRVKRGRGRADDELDGYDGGDEDAAARVCVRRAVAGGSSARSERMECLFAAYRQRSPRATSDLLIGSVAADAFSTELKRVTQDKLQEMIDWAPERHCCYVRGLTDAPPTVVKKTPLKVQDLRAWYDVMVPRLLCQRCGEWDVQAEECGCFPASPVAPTLWFMTAVLEFYHHLLLRGGQSAEGTELPCSPDNTSTPDAHRHMRIRRLFCNVAGRSRRRCQ